MAAMTGIYHLKEVEHLEEKKESKEKRWNKVV